MKQCKVRILNKLKEVFVVLENTKFSFSSASQIFIKFNFYLCFADLQRRMEAALGGPLDSSSIEFHSVRVVAPNKQMFCASFRVPTEIAFASDNGEKKRQRTE
jgi:hypothetical protein